jgi:hypothetical protein
MLTHFVSHGALPKLVVHDHGQGVDGSQGGGLVFLGGFVLAGEKEKEGQQREEFEHFHGYGFMGNSCTISTGFPV